MYSIALEKISLVDLEQYFIGYFVCIIGFLRALVHGLNFKHPLIFLIGYYVKLAMQPEMDS